MNEISIPLKFYLPRLKPFDRSSLRRALDKYVPTMGGCRLHEWFIDTFALPLDSAPIIPVGQWNDAELVEALQLSVALAFAVRSSKKPGALGEFLTKVTFALLGALKYRTNPLLV